MKTSDFRFTLSSEQLNESLQQKFGGKVDIESFNHQQLVRSSKLIENKIEAIKKSGFNSALDNEEFHKLKLMKDVIETKIRELVREAKKAKPDFLDFDKDGNKKEPMKKAAKDKYNKYDKSKTVKEGWKMGGLGAGLAGLLGAGPLGMGAGYLLGSKVGDDIDESVEPHIRAIHHAIQYAGHHGSGNLEDAMHHRDRCTECGGTMIHGSMGECMMSHPMIDEGNPHVVDEGILKYAIPMGIAGLGGYALGNPEAFGGIGGKAMDLGGQAMGAGKELLGSYLNTGAKAVDDIGRKGIGSAESTNRSGARLMESDTSMCELAMHHAAEYQKNHKLGNLKHCEHHKTNVEECGGKMWHEGNGDVYFSHHHYKNGVPEKVSEGFYSALGGLGGGIGGAIGGHKLAPALSAGAQAIGTTLLGSPLDQATADMIGSGLGTGGGAILGGDLGRRAGGVVDRMAQEGTGKKMTPKEKKLAAKYPPKDKITRGDVITAAKEKNKKESVDRMLKESIRFYLREGEEGKAEVIMAVKDMVDKFTGWSEDIAQMQANTAMEMADSIRDELGSQVSAQFTQAAGPALDSAFQAVKAAREALNGIVGIITGEGGPAMGGMPGAAPMGGAPGGMPGAAPIGGAPGGMPPLDAGAAGPGAGAEEEEEAPSAGRAKRESVERTFRIAKILAGR